METCQGYLLVGIQLKGNLSVIIRIRVLYPKQKANSDFSKTIACIQQPLPSIKKYRRLGGS